MCLVDIICIHVGEVWLLIYCVLQGDNPSDSGNHDAQSTSSELLDLLLQEDARSGTGSNASGSGSLGSGSGSNGTSTSHTGNRQIRLQHIFCSVLKLTNALIFGLQAAATAANTLPAMTRQIHHAKPVRAKRQRKSTNMTLRVRWRTLCGALSSTHPSMSWWHTRCTPGRRNTFRSKTSLNLQHRIYANTKVIFLTL